MLRAYRFRLYPTPKQELLLNQVLDTHRVLYNEALTQRRDSWSRDKASISYAQQSKWFKSLRSSHACYKSLNFSSAQGTLRRLDKAFQAFFRRMKEHKVKSGYPRFKSLDRWSSVLFPSNGDGIRLKGNKLRVQGFDKPIRVRKHRDEEGEVKTVSIKREANHWYVIMACEQPDHPFVPNGKPSVGIDMGLTSFLTTSDGEKIENPRFLKESLPELRRDGRSLARKHKGSRKRAKAKEKLQKAHSKVANQRRDFVHKASRSLVGRFGLISAEKLAIKNMVKNHCLARSIMDAGWGMFLEATRGKAEEAGCKFEYVDPKGTSQDCSGCGRQVPKDLSVRWHGCPHCGLSLDRDENAARNILFLALGRTGPASGETNFGLQHGDESLSLSSRSRLGSPRH